MVLRLVGLVEEGKKRAAKCTGGILLRAHPFAPSTSIHRPLGPVWINEELNKIKCISHVE